jgi:sirohydrochlorin cobaltochelatase
MLDVLRTTYPDVEFVLSGAIGEHPSVIQAMAAATLEVAGL